MHARFGKCGTRPTGGSTRRGAIIRSSIAFEVAVAGAFDRRRVSRQPGQVVTRELTLLLQAAHRIKAIVVSTLRWLANWPASHCGASQTRTALRSSSARI